MRSVNRRAFLGLMVIGLFLFCAPEALCALDGIHNRPNPYMDYVPQEVGIYDAGYQDLTEIECRQCHGASLAGRHHISQIVTRDRLCAPCHDLIPNPPGVLVYRNCVVDAGTAGCHSWESVLQGGNGWHHETATWEEPESCVTCHNPNLIAPIGEFQSFEQFPPSAVSPVPFGCEDCHWDQRVAAGAPEPIDPAEAGHPSTFNHHDLDGNDVGYFWYGRKIQANDDTHHMGLAAGFAGHCDKCHSMDPTDETWDPYNPELIRYCEVCHSRGVLHTIPDHVNDSPGWEAVGFHTPDPDTEPTGYRSFTDIERCFACHVGDPIPVPPTVDVCTGNVPAISHVGGISPNRVSFCGTMVTLRGENFGEEQYPGYHVQMRKTDSDLWTNIPVGSWAPSQIQFGIGPWALYKGNYRVRVHNDCGDSNQVGFLCLWSPYSNPSGPCGTWIWMSGYCWAKRSSKPSEGDGYNGRTCLVDFVSTEGTYTAKAYRNWTADSFEVRVMDFFVDAPPRNYVQDPTEATIRECAGLPQGNWDMQLVTVFYEDADGSDSLSSGDTITNVSLSETTPFAITNDPSITKLKPKEMTAGSRLRISGYHFGDLPEDGQIRIGSKSAALDYTLGQGIVLDGKLFWSNTLLKVKLNVPTKWEGKTKSVWVEKDGKKSNYQQVKILPAAP